MVKQIPSRSFSIQYDRRVTEIITEIYISVAFDPSKPPFPKPNKFYALWDTGASGSVVSQKVVKDCNLKPTGMVKSLTANGIRHSNTYLVNTGLPNKVAMAELRVTDGNLLGNFDVLIGMDIIGRGDFAITNKDNKTLVSYRFPSLAKIDFVKPENRVDAGTFKQTRDGKISKVPTQAAKKKKVGRNAKCPCGSGKKYKKCCLGK